MTAILWITRRYKNNKKQGYRDKRKVNNHSNALDKEETRATEKRRYRGKKGSTMTATLGGRGGPKQWKRRYRGRKGSTMTATLWRDERINNNEKEIQK